MKKLLSNKWTWVIAGIIIIAVFLYLRNKKAKEAEAKKSGGTVGSRIKLTGKTVSQAPKMTRATVLTAPQTTGNV